MHAGSLACCIDQRGMLIPTVEADRCLTKGNLSLWRRHQSLSSKDRKLVKPSLPSCILHSSGLKRASSRAFTLLLYQGGNKASLALPPFHSFKSPRTLGLHSNRKASNLLALM